MDTLYQVIAWVSIPVTLFSVVYMVLTWRRERVLTLSSLWIPIILSSASLYFWARLSNVEIEPLTSWLPLVAALALGVFVGRRNEISADGDEPSATRSPWSFLVWGASYVATQLVALLAPEATGAMVALLFAATGLTIGEQLALLFMRSSRLSQMKAVGAAAAAIVAVVALAAAFMPQSGFAADQTYDIQQVASVRQNDGSLTSAMDNVVVVVNSNGQTYSGPSINVSITNDTEDTLRIHIPVGTRLYPDNTNVQTMLAAGDETIEVPPGQTVTETIQAYCGEASDSAPGSGDNFTVGEPVPAGPLLDSLNGISDRFDDADPETFDYHQNQRVAVWTHTDPASHPPPAEDDPDFELYQPSADGPTIEEAGQAGGMAGAINAAGAALVARPTGGKKGNGRSGTTSKGGEEAGSSGPDTDAGIEEFEELLEEGGSGAKDAPPSKPLSEDERELYVDTTTPKETTPQAEKKPPEKKEPPPRKPDTYVTPDYQLGPVGVSSDAGQVTLDTGSGQVRYDTTSRTGGYEDRNVVASYDLDDNVGKLDSKDGRVKFRSERGNARLDIEHDAGNESFQFSRSSDGTKKGIYNFDSTSGGRDIDLELTLGPDGTELSFTRGDRTDALRTGDGTTYEQTRPGNYFTAFHDTSRGTGFQWLTTRDVQLGRTDWTVTHGPTLSTEGWRYDLDATTPVEVPLLDLDVEVGVNAFVEDWDETGRRSDVKGIVRWKQEF